MTKYERKLFQNLYKLASHHAVTNHLRANDLGATDHARAKADGLALAYDYITFMLKKTEILADADYDKASNRRTDLPSWMQGETD